MGRPRQFEEPWYQPVAASIVRDGLTYRDALTLHAVPLGSDEAARHYRRQEFQRILRLERNRFYRELANDPERNKQTAIGMLLRSLERLEEAGEDEKVVEGILKLARVEGWIGGDSNINILSGMSAREIEEAKQQLLAQLKHNGRESEDPAPAGGSEQAKPVN